MNRRVVDDEMLRCERCGVTFLWTQEEQRQKENAPRTRPEHCPGCRALLPQPNRERGLVKWYSTRSKYGFVSRADGPDIFAHRSGFDGVGRLRTGDLVEFAVAQGEKGPMAVDLRLVQREAAARKDEPEEDEENEEETGRS